MTRYPAWRNIVRDAFHEANGGGTAAFDTALKRKITLPFKRASKRGHKCPYAFNAKTMHDVVDYLLSDRKPYGTRYGIHFFAWNVKAQRVNGAHPKGEHNIDPALDKAWENYISTHPSVDERAFENARRQIIDDEWTSYPGDDQGDWEFQFEGRSGGWLVLNRWKGLPMNDFDYLCEFIGDKLACGDWATIVKFYCGIVTADHDFTGEKASEEVEFHYNDLRHEWETDRKVSLGGHLHNAVEQALTKTLTNYGYDAHAFLATHSIGTKVAALVEEVKIAAREM